MEKQQIYERIKKCTKAPKGKYDMRFRELVAIADCSPGFADAIGLAFNYGFEKGCKNVQKRKAPLIGVRGAVPRGT